MGKASSGIVKTDAAAAAMTRIVVVQNQSAWFENRYPHAVDGSGVGFSLKVSFPSL